MKILKRVAVILSLLALLFVAVLYVAGKGTFGTHEGPGVITGGLRSETVVQASRERVTTGAVGIGAKPDKQILFGDLHVHTTFSADAFLISLPLLQGEGAHPPADACDFARHCSALDFWSINDHAEGISPQNWDETVESIRACNEKFASRDEPDTVAFLGWEWTHVGDTPEQHYGHKNVVLASIEEGQIPTRPIAATGSTVRAGKAGDISPLQAGALAIFGAHPRYHDFVKYLAERKNVELCPDNVHVKDLPPDCLETADTPVELFRKLDEWDFDSIVIPHGTTWGYYTPPGATWDKQLNGKVHDPNRQTLFEIYSGHGESDVYRDFRGVLFDEAGMPYCPEPTTDYLPSCWRAGEIIEDRCTALGESADECAARAAVARDNAARALGQGHLTISGQTGADWLDAGQCRDCELGTFNYRPGGSAQYVMALGNFDQPGDPKHFRFGFMASSDNHFARPGTGYKETHRLGYTESRAGIDGGSLSTDGEEDSEVLAHSEPYDLASNDGRIFDLFEGERQGSFFMTGGLVAVHAEGRDREAVWGALKRKEVYGTSGPRILLWFDLENPPGNGSTLGMGSEVAMSTAPEFSVRAVGSFEQRPGCPTTTLNALGEERMERICMNECYFPSDERRPITRIDIVRIRPQQSPGEIIADLIDDPWRRFNCDGDPTGCAVSFSDPEFSTGARDSLYYARAYEAPSSAVNAAGIRCEAGSKSDCETVELCGEDPNNPECLAPHEPRAWSSPIFVNFAGASHGG